MRPHSRYRNHLVCPIPLVLKYNWVYLFLLVSRCWPHWALHRQRPGYFLKPWDSHLPFLTQSKVPTACSLFLGCCMFVSSFVLGFLYVPQCFVCMCVCTLYRCLVPWVARRWLQIPYNWGYRWAWVTTWVLGIKPVSSWRMPVFLTAEPYLQLCFKVLCFCFCDKISLYPGLVWNLTRSSSLSFLCLRL